MQIGLGLGLTRRAGAGGGASGPWWLAGGIDPANVAAVWQPKGAASLAASYVNLANPGTFDLTVGKAPSFDPSVGWTFNGTDQYLKTGILADLSSYGVLVRFSAVSAGNLIGAGVLATMNVLSLQYNPSRFVFGCGHASSSYEWSGSFLSGVAGVKFRNAFKDGIKVGEPLGDAVELSAEVFIGALNLEDMMTIQYYGGSIQALAFYDPAPSNDVFGIVSAEMARL